jgi:hypothetical protein
VSYNIQEILSLREHLISMVSCCFSVVFSVLSLVFCLSCVLCVQCRQWIWIGHSWLPIRFSLTFICTLWLCILWITFLNGVYLFVCFENFKPVVMYTIISIRLFLLSVFYYTLLMLLVSVKCIYRKLSRRNFVCNPLIRKLIKQ